MTKDVLIKISGVQSEIVEVKEEDDVEEVEVISSGSYFFKNGKHYIFFEEKAEGVKSVTQIRYKGTTCLEVIKKGVINTHMTFEKEKKSTAVYGTPYGDVRLGISTRNIMIEEQEDNINIKVEYVLELSEDAYTYHVIRINVKPKDSKDFSLQEPLNF